MAKALIHTLTNGLGIEAMSSQGNREARFLRGGTESLGLELLQYKVDNKQATTWLLLGDVWSPVLSRQETNTHSKIGQADVTTSVMSRLY